MLRLVLILCCFIPFVSLTAQMMDSVGVIKAPAAHQAVASDSGYVYAISNTTIEKYDKERGVLVRKWEDTTGIFKHLNSGVVLDGKLYCAHSNFPDIPMASSIEIFDAEDLRPIGSHSFGIDIGSATWLDWYDGHWYVGFAHYYRYREETGKDNAWTQIVKYSPDWERLGGWILPADLLDRFGRMSNSGGIITPEGKIYLTGHDFKELYEMAFPEHGYSLQWIGTIPAPFEGQGISADPGDPSVFYGISRSRREIIKGRLSP